MFSTANSIKFCFRLMARFVLEVHSWRMRNFVNSERWNSLYSPKAKYVSGEYLVVFITDRWFNINSGDIPFELQATEAICVSLAYVLHRILLRIYKIDFPDCSCSHGGFHLLLTNVKVILHISLWLFRIFYVNLMFVHCINFVVQRMK